MIHKTGRFLIPNLASQEIPCQRQAYPQYIYFNWKYALAVGMLGTYTESTWIFKPSEHLGEKESSCPVWQRFVPGTCAVQTSMASRAGVKTCCNTQGIIRRCWENRALWYSNFPFYSASGSWNRKPNFVLRAGKISVQKKFRGVVNWFCFKIIFIITWLLLKGWTRLNGTGGEF